MLVRYKLNQDKDFEFYSDDISSTQEMHVILLDYSMEMDHNYFHTTIASYDNKHE